MYKNYEAAKAFNQKTNDMVNDAVKFFSQKVNFMDLGGDSEMNGFAMKYLTDMVGLVKMYEGMLEQQSKTLDEMAEKIDKIEESTSRNEDNTLKTLATVKVILTSEKMEKKD